MAYLCQPPTLDGALEGGNPGECPTRVARRKLKAPPVGVVKDEHRNLTVAEDEQLWRLFEQPALGLGWEVRADVRERNTPNMLRDLLVQYAQRKGDVYRRRLQERKDEGYRRAEARRIRRAARPAPRKYVTAAVIAPSQVVKVPLGPSRWGAPKVGEANFSRRDPPKVGEAGLSR